VNAAVEFVTKLGPARVAAMGAVTLALIAFFGFVIIRVSQPTMGILYTDLSLEDASTIIRDLESKGITYETRADGQTILAPRSDLARIRMDMASKGMPSGGGIGYEIFDKGDAFSSTSFVQNINHLRALEGELSRTIRSIDRVQAARVHLVIPERRLFDRDREPPRASIALKLKGNLEAGQVRAIRHLVASAVEGLKPENISIIDEQGRLLADGAQGESSLTALAIDEKQAGIERRLRSQVEEIVAGVVGSGRARVQVAADLDFNRVESRSENFDPESRVVRSTQTRTENQVTSGQDGSVSVGNELPGANQQPNTPGPKDASNKNEEVINYEISRTTRTEVLEGGRLKRLSVAVLVDGTYTKGDNGEMTYKPRTPEELDQIAALVRTAIGYDKNRGDQVEVVNLRFADAPQALDLKEEGGASSFLNPSPEDLVRYAELAVITFLTLIVLMTVVRPLVRKVIGPDTSRPTAVAALAAAAAAPAEGTSEATPIRESQAARMIELARVNGQVQQQSLERIGELVKGSPNESVSVLRQWIHEQS
jgi:flagellar M-ring protein FliF